MTSAPTLTDPAASLTDDGNPEVTTVAPQAIPAQHGLTGHSHIGGRSVPAQLNSHLHGIGSADLADHPVPSGKEENWRFTPLRRLRGLEVDAPFDGVMTDEHLVIDAPEPVVIRRLTGAEAAELKGVAGQLPTDRPAARAWAASTSVLLVDIPALDAMADGIWPDNDHGAAHAPKQLPPAYKAA